MKNLLKVELYRFRHSFSIMKYVIWACVGSFAVCIFDFASAEEKVSSEAVLETAHFAFFYILIFLICIIAVYIGREFKEKTIYYEYMRGYHPLEILGAKISTCGIMTAITVTLLTFIYFCLFSVPLTGKVMLQLLLIFLIMLHWCCAAVFYIMIMRSGIWGGIVAFIRFVLLEGVANSVLLICPEKVRKICSLFIVLDQSASITQGNISVERALAVPVSFAVGSCCCLETVDNIGCDLHCGMTAEGNICAVNIVINGLGQSDNVKALLRKQVCGFMSAVSAKGEQTVKLLLLVGILHLLYLVDIILADTGYWYASFCLCIHGYSQS